MMSIACQFDLTQIDPRQANPQPETRSPLDLNPLRSTIFGEVVKPSEYYRLITSRALKNIADGKS